MERSEVRPLFLQEEAYKLPQRIFEGNVVQEGRDERGWTLGDAATFTSEKAFKRQLCPSSVRFVNVPCELREEQELSARGGSAPQSAHGMESAQMYGTEVV